MKKYFLILLASVSLISCGSGNDEKKGSNEPTSNNVATQPKQLNITLLLDLSDRIDPKKNPEKPEHYERDIAIIKYFSELFVNDMEKRGTYMAKGKIKVIFSPKPQDPNVNLYAEKLSADLSGMDVKQKKEIHDSLTSIFPDNISKIYNATISQNKWIGSDIWRFFKNDVKDYCVDNDTNYRNILVILTDGYIYHQDSKDQNGNRYAYLLPTVISKYKLRNNPNWQQEIDNKDFGLIVKRDDLENLEVLVLEVTPSLNYKDDEDIIKYVLAKWFKEMKVKRYGIYNSDLPEYTKQRINDFIK